MRLHIFEFDPRFLGMTALALASCTTHQPLVADKDVSISDRAVAVIDQPLTDLNLINADIPKVLLKAQLAPYATPHPADCHSLDNDIAALTAVLGPDLDTTTTAYDGPILSEESAGDAAWNTARGAVAGLIPFHGVLRVITGAERHQHRVQHAVLTGIARRAYLKGLRADLDCPAGMSASIEAKTSDENSTQPKPRQ